MNDGTRTENGCPGKAVILGASGFIGTNLAHHLVANGLQVTCFSRNSSLHWPDECTIISGDITCSPQALLDAMNGADVYHLAGTTSPTNSTGKASSELVENVVATLNLLQQTVGIDCRWIFASSGGTVYGPTNVEPIPEDHANRPISSYGISKLAIEHYFHLFRTLHNTKYVIARISNPFGPHQSSKKGQGLVATLFDKITSRSNIEIWGDGEHVRDYIYIDDVVNALRLLAEKGRSGEIYNVGTGIGTSVNCLVTMVSSFLDIPAQARHVPQRGVDVPSNVLDIRKIGREIGWRARYGIDEGIAETYDWLTAG